VDSNNDGEINSVDDAIEGKSPGLVIAKDLEGDGPSRDDVRESRVRVSPQLSGGAVELSAGSGIALWNDRAKSNRIGLPAALPASAVPASLWVDGTEKNTLPAITLTYQHPNSSGDEISITSDTIQVLVTETPSWSPAKKNTVNVWLPLKTPFNDNPGNDLGWGDADLFLDLIKDQGWQAVARYEDTTGDKDDKFETCTIDNYLKMKDTGMAYVVSHGEPGAHDAVYAAYTPAGKAAIDAWIAGQPGMTCETWRPPNNPNYPVGCYVAKVPGSWMTSHWKQTLNKNKAIFMWGICYSDSIKDAAGGRWRSGYVNPTNEGECEGVNEQFLKRMNGTFDSARKRTAGEAWGGGAGYTSNVRMSGNGWTTLCPAPMAERRVWPAGSAFGFGFGCIIFDTYMNDTRSPGDALIRTMGGPTCNHRWGPETVEDAGTKFLLGFDFENPPGVSTRMIAVATECTNKDPDGGRELDGDRVAPHKDPADWGY
jgi:hypothetical protein